MSGQHDKLTAKQNAFITEYLSNGRDATAAYRSAYTVESTAPNHAAHEAHLLLQHPKIAPIVAQADERDRAAVLSALEAYGLSQEDVFKRWVAIATADPNDLIQHRRAPCRHCNGAEHKYQWKTEREFLEASDKATRESSPEPTNEGGYGYRTTAPINPDCPECSGEGVGYTLAVDTRSLVGPARLLYAGTKQTREGLEIKMHDQIKALESVARHLGMFVEKKQMLGADGKPTDPGKAIYVFSVQK